MVSGKDQCSAVDLQHCGSELKTLPFLVDYWQMSSLFWDLCSVLQPHHYLDFRKEYANMKLFSIPSATGRKQTTAAKITTPKQVSLSTRNSICSVSSTVQGKQNKMPFRSTWPSHQKKQLSILRLLRHPSEKSAVIYIGTISLLQPVLRKIPMQILLADKYHPVLTVFTSFFPSRLFSLNVTNRAKMLQGLLDCLKLVCFFLFKNK